MILTKYVKIDFFTIWQEAPKEGLQTKQKHKKKEESSNGKANSRSDQKEKYLTS